MEKTLDQMIEENNALFAQILSDLKEIGEMNKKTCSILKDCVTCFGALV